VEQLQDAMRELRDAITLEVTREYLGVVKSGKQIQVAAQMIRQSEENERIVRDKYGNGLALTTDLLDAELSLLKAKLSCSRARIDYMVGLASLRRATGRLPGDWENGD
jgi:outer membrane protein TolC